VISVVLTRWELVNSRETVYTGGNEINMLDRKSESSCDRESAKAERDKLKYENEYLARAIQWARSRSDKLRGVVEGVRHSVSTMTTSSASGVTLEQFQQAVLWEFDRLDATPPECVRGVVDNAMQNHPGDFIGIQTGSEGVFTEDDPVLIIRLPKETP
jgi:hypothetical protein